MHFIFIKSRHSCRWTIYYFDSSCETSQDWNQLFFSRLKIFQSTNSPSFASARDASPTNSNTQVIYSFIRDTTISRNVIRGLSIVRKRSWRKRTSKTKTRLRKIARCHPFSIRNDVLVAPNRDHDGRGRSRRHRNDRLVRETGFLPQKGKPSFNIYSYLLTGRYFSIATIRTRSNIANANRVDKRFLKSVIVSGTGTASISAGIKSGNST